MNAATTLEADARTAGVDYFDPEHYLLGTLHRAAANKQDIYIEGGSHGELMLLSSRGEYFGIFSEPRTLLTCSPSDVQVTILDQEKSEMLASGQVGRNIDELLWQAAYYASEGRMMSGIYRDDVVELEYWPNFSRVPHTPNSMRIAALLSRHPTSIHFASRLLKVEQSEMFQFYSAARAAGFARAINRKVEEPKLQPHRNQSLLSSLLKKIAGL